MFIRDNVDAAIYGVGVGDAWDSTNVVEVPSVTGTTKLGIDRIGVLGDTIDEITRHKAGILNAKCPAFTIEQVPLASEILEQRADDMGISLHTVGIHSAILRVSILPDADFQRQNASIAIVLAVFLLGKVEQETSSLSEDIPPTIKEILENSRWRGRFEIKLDGKSTWYLDGPYTKDSLKVGGRWFAAQVEQKQAKLSMVSHDLPLVKGSQRFSSQKSGHELDS